MGVGCCVRVLRARSQRLWTKPQGATGGVPGVNGVGPLQGTHTHRYRPRQRERVRFLMRERAWESYY